MPRPLVFGNGRLLVQVDHRGNIRDLCWPIGIWNHLAGRAIRTGIWVDGSFAWLDYAGWERRHVMQTVEGEAGPIGVEEHTNNELGLTVRFVEGLVPGEDAFQRTTTIVNHRGQSRDVRVFVTSDLRLMEGDIGDCAFWHPELRSLVHYKGQIVLLITAEGADQYACGITEFGDAQGTWRDAEDGELSVSPIAQGSVDSTLRVKLEIEANGSSSFPTTIAFFPSIDALRSVEPYQFPEPNQTSIFDTALHLDVIRTQTTEAGAVLAANDSDIMATNRANYSYCWVRDGVHIAEAVAQTTGDATLRDAFIDWAAPLLDERPYFLQKYRADGTFGASWHPWTQNLPIQLDETASFLSLICGTPGNFQTRERITTFLMDYRQDDMPRPSYDLWEETWGVHIYTMATVVKALRDAGHSTNRMTKALTSRFYQDGYFRRNLDDDRPDASSLFVGLLGILPIDDPRVQSNARQVREALWVKDGVGGLARYPGDYYFRQNDRHPGNPWIICTLWLAQHEALSGRRHRAEELVDWVVRHADPTGVLPEQVHPETGHQLSVSPLTWSHAEFLKTLHLLR